MKRLFLSLSILLLAHLCSKAQTPWSGFKWGHDSITVNNQRAFVPRSAIFLPVSFDGDPRSYYLQLDLSSYIPILLYGTPTSIDNKLINNQAFNSNKLNKCFRIETTLKGTLGNEAFSLDSAQYCLMRSNNDTSKNYTASTFTAIIGTIGLNYFLSKTLIVDFPHQQFMVLDDTAKVPPRFKKSLFYVPAHVSNSRLLVPITFGDTTLKDFFYETGSGIFDMMTSKKVWKKLTGKTGDEKENYHIKVTAWGNKIDAIGAPSKTPLRVGNIVMPVAIVFYLSGDEDFKYTYGCDGMVGNSPFLGKVIVFDFSRNRFGVFNPL